MLALLLALVIGATPSPVLSVPPDPQDVWIDALTQCESTGSTTVKVLDTDGYYSYGLGQFHMQTWLTFGKAFGATKDNIYDGDLQRVVIKDMLDKGLWRQWYNCGKLVIANYGPYP